MSGMGLAERDDEGEGKAMESVRRWRGVKLGLGLVRPEIDGAGDVLGDVSGEKEQERWERDGGARPALGRLLLLGRARM